MWARTSCVFLLLSSVFSNRVHELHLPLVVSLWDFTEATRVAWNELKHNNGTAVTAAVVGCEYCELTHCPGVGLGDTTDEWGESYIAATIFDGSNLRVGTVGYLPNVPQGIRTAYFVLTHTRHSVIVGRGGRSFARKMGLELGPGTSPEATQDYLNWKKNNCQKNYWKNVSPDPTTSCGPYTRVPSDPTDLAPPRPPPNPFVFTPRTAHVTPNVVEASPLAGTPDGVSIIAIDASGNIAAGSSSGGSNHRLPGRLDDVASPGSAAYASNDYGAAVTTGTGDILVGFSPASLAVTWLELGKRPQQAAEKVIAKINKWYPNTVAGIVVVGINGEIGAACSGQSEIKYTVASDKVCGGNIYVVAVKCTKF